MTITAAESAAYSRLRGDGATPLEAAIVLSVIREVDGVIELAEARDTSGRFTSGASAKAHATASATARRTARRTASLHMRQAQQRARANKMPGEKIAALVTPSPNINRRNPVASPDINAAQARSGRRKGEANRTHAVESLTSQIADETMKTRADKIMADTQDKISKATEQLTAAQEANVKKDARKKIAGHIGVIAAGGVLAMIEAKLGTPGIVQAASGIGPAVVQELYDFKNKLLWRLTPRCASRRSR